MARFDLIETTPCAECGMPCTPGEFHPFAACLMFKGCRNSTTVRANLAALAPAAAPEAGEWVMVPRVPTQPMLEILRNEDFNVDWPAGKAMQVAHGFNVVPPECGMEVAAGQYVRMLAAAPAPQEGGREAKPKTGTVADIPDADLLARVVRHLAPRARRQPAWARISDTFGLGSTYATQLCRRFSVDPETGKRTEYAALAAHQQRGNDNG